MTGCARGVVMVMVMKMMKKEKHNGKSNVLRQDGSPLPVRPNFRS